MEEIKNGITRSAQYPGGVYKLAGQQIARIGYGAMQLRGYESNPYEATKLLERAIAMGVSHIDTAQFYGNGFVNKAIRKVLQPGNDILIATKVGADPNPGGKHPLKLAQRPEQLRASVEDNLITLGLTHIPLVNLRRMDVGPGVPPEGDQSVDIDDQLAELISLRNEGKIGAIGLSGVGLDELIRALPADIACVQNAYSLVSRQFENMLEYCLVNQIAWVPFFPLGGAADGWPKVQGQQQVIDIAKRLNVTPAQVGLTWLLQHAPNMLLIPGTASIGHLEENMFAATVILDQKAIETLDNIYTSPQ